MDGWDVIKLEFADLEDTVLYLDEHCPVEIKRWTDDKCNGEIRYVLCIETHEHCIWMNYTDEKLRDRDYEYAIEQLDILMRPMGMNVDKEEY